MLQFLILCVNRKEQRKKEGLKEGQELGLF